MKKIVLYLTILIVLSGCSAARPVIRTEETSARTTAAALSGEKTGGAATGDSQTKSAGLVAVSTNADTQPQSTKADLIKNAADKTMGSPEQPTDPVTNPGTDASTQSPGTAAETGAPPAEKPVDSNVPDTKPAATSTQAFEKDVIIQSKKSQYSLLDYYPLIANRQVDLTGPAGDNSLILQYLYEESGKLTAQFKQFTKEASQLNVISITDHEITELYYSQDISYRENIIGLKDYVQRVILKAPLTLGNQWDSTGLHFEITAVDESRVIKGQNMTVMDVTVSTGAEKILFTYAVGAGLVSNDVINPDGSLGNIVEVARIIDDARDVYSMDFYFPGKNGEVYLVSRDVEFKTNEASKDKLTEVYKDIAAKQGYLPVLGAKTQIKYIFSKDGIVHVDLNEAFIEFINQTPALEDQRLGSLVDTICSFYGAEGLILTINDQRYESVNRKIEATQILRPLYKATTTP